MPHQSSQKITDKSDPNDKFSVRAETGKALNTLKLSQKYQKQQQVLCLDYPLITPQYAFLITH